MSSAAASGPHRSHWVVVAPHYAHPGHLGAVRTARYRRWLTDGGRFVTVIRAGSSDRVEDREWGVRITVKDPLGFYRDPLPDAAVPPPPRPPNRLRSLVAHFVFVPDPVVVWARRVERSSMVREALSGVDWVLSSSPPESCHIAAATVARRSGAAHLVDFRDGWLDEPMIPMLAASALQRWRHRRMEVALVAGARAIVVTSRGWRDLLIARYPEAEAKTSVLSNAYPVVDDGSRREVPQGCGETVTLLYTGKIFSSRPERHVAQLMQPLVKGIEHHRGKGVIEFIGNLRGDEIRDLRVYEPALHRLGWRLSIRPPVPHSELWRRIDAADGLLLLATSRASIPAKLFDYVPSRRPILAVTPESSEIDRLAASIPQLFVCRLDGRRDSDSAADFLNAAATGRFESGVPEEFTESVLQRRFERLIVSDPRPAPTDKGRRTVDPPFRG